MDVVEYMFFMYVMMTDNSSMLEYQSKTRGYLVLPYYVAHSHLADVSSYASHDSSCVLYHVIQDD